MKIRIGFVSNSSSSSYVVIGYSLSAKQYKNYIASICGSKDMIVEIDDAIYLGVIVSSEDRDGRTLNPEEEIDWETVKKITDEGAKIGLGRPRIFKFSIEN